jgi:arabinose-5-phosphate isomerase
VEPIPIRRPQADAEIASASRALRAEMTGLLALEEALQESMREAFMRACAMIREAEGRVVVTGMGKSGHIGRKIAATLASTGTPAFFVHPAEAGHGDLGMITPQDVVLAFSWSGETEELRHIVEYSRRFRVPFIAVTSGATSSLASSADLVLQLPHVEEACPHGLAPTTSTLVQLALGDALAITLLEARRFSAEDFHNFHPRGKLGASLRHVRDVMHEGERLPLAPLGTPMNEALLLITQKGFGCLGITNQRGELVGIITDGDLRRHLTGDILVRPVEQVMTREPKTIAPDALVASALEVLNSASILALLVVENKKPVGIVHMHDLLKIGIA